jgi:hypothetical protein
MRFIALCFLAVLSVAAFGSPALAQISMPSLDIGGPQHPPLTPEEQAKRDRLNEAYKQKLKQIPDKPAADPWGGMRENGSKGKAGQK